MSRYLSSMVMMTMMDDGGDVAAGPAPSVRSLLFSLQRRITASSSRPLPPAADGSAQQVGRRYLEAGFAEGNGLVACGAVCE